MRETEGLGLLDVETVMEPEKTVRNVSARSHAFRHSRFGYEIHLGRTTRPGLLGRRTDRWRRGRRELGRREVFGTYLHGLFGADLFRARFLKVWACDGGMDYRAEVERARTRSPPNWKPTSTAMRSSRARGRWVQARRLRSGRSRLFVSLRPICAERPDVAFRVGANEVAAAIVAVGWLLKDFAACRLGPSNSPSVSSTAT